MPQKKVAVDAQILSLQATWLREQATSYSLPDAGKAFRCCVNFAAQTGQVVQAAPPLEEAQAAVESMSFELSSEQSSWLQHVAQTAFDGDVSRATQALLTLCMDAAGDAVFGVVRCKSATPTVNCEGYKTAIAAGLPEANAVDGAILVTGSEGHLGEALVRYFRDARRQVLGLDVLQGDHTSCVGSVTDKAFVDSVFSSHKITAVIHTATLHKPHILSHSKQDFVDVNVTGTLNLLEAAKSAGVRRFIFTSSTTVLGHAIPRPSPSAAGLAAHGEAEANAKAHTAWINEDVVPVARNIYGATKLAAENICNLFHHEHGMSVVVLRTSRFFPEDDDDAAIAASYSIQNMQMNELTYRRVDISDAVDAHILALDHSAAFGFDVFIISAPPPFTRDDVEALSVDAPSVLEKKFGEAFSRTYKQYSWTMLQKLDRVYDCSKAMKHLGWKPQFTFEHGLAALAAAGTDPEAMRSSLARSIPAKGYHRTSS